MLDFQREFIELAIEQRVLRFGEFTLKSGRKSPYFFNAGLFCTGSALAKLGRYYAAALSHSGIVYDLLFGPAYKGIPLVSATAVALADHHHRDVPYAFNRKETKSHGEGGNIVGAPLVGKIVLIDDVITAGTAIREVIQLTNAHGAQLAGILVGLNRQERGQGQLSAMQELEQEFSIPVISIAALEHIIAYLEEKIESQSQATEVSSASNTATDEDVSAELLQRVRRYRSEYGA